jgi:hypothetical protein
MKYLMRKDPVERPSAAEALSHSWILNYCSGIDRDSKYLSIVEDQSMELSEVQKNLALMKLRFPPK